MRDRAALSVALIFSPPHCESIRASAASRATPGHGNFRIRIPGENRERTAQPADRWRTDGGPILFAHAARDDDELTMISARCDRASSVADRCGPIFRVFRARASRAAILRSGVGDNACHSMGTQPRRAGGTHRVDAAAGGASARSQAGWSADLLFFPDYRLRTIREQAKSSSKRAMPETNCPRLHCLTQGVHSNLR
jgi:hypothetical protein